MHFGEEIGRVLEGNHIWHVLFLLCVAMFGFLHPVVSVVRIVCCCGVGGF